MKRSVRVLLCALAGAASVLAFAPFSFAPLAPLTLAVLLAVLHRQQTSIGESFLLGLVWGWCAFVAGVSWLYIALNRYGGVPMPLAALAIALFCLWLALFPALAAAAMRWLMRWQKNNAILLTIACAALWTLSEWLRGSLLTGFPWLASGYSQALADNWLRGFFPLVGVYGVGFLLALMAAAVVLLRWRQSVFVLAAVILGGFFASGVEWTQAGDKTLRVSLLQTNVDQGLKWSRQHLPLWIARYTELIRRHPAQLIVLPETALPALADTLPASVFTQLTRAAGENSTLISGLFVRDAAGRIYNSAQALGADGGQRYRKHHLVPFGEYSPPFFSWFYRIADIPMSNQSAGAAQQAPFAINGENIALNICYENLFGHEIARNATAAGALLNLSNLAWYGDSFAQPQHLQISQARALETARPFLAATNSGETAVIAHNGVIGARLPAFEQGGLHYTLTPRHGLTPYLRWRDAPIIALCFFIAAVACVRTIHARKKARTK